MSMRAVGLLVCAASVVGACGGSTPGVQGTTTQVADTSTSSAASTSTSSTTTQVADTSTSSTTSTSTLPLKPPTTISDGLLLPEDPECTVLMAFSWFGSEFASTVAFTKSDAASTELATALATLGYREEQVSSLLAGASAPSIAAWLGEVMSGTILVDPATNQGDVQYVLICAGFPARWRTYFTEDPGRFFAEMYASRYGLPGEIPRDPLQVAFGNGSWHVGTDIRPGQYVSAGGPDCGWSRLNVFRKDKFAVGIEDIITNDYGGGPFYVFIEATDVAFLSDNCATWEPIGA